MKPPKVTSVKRLSPQQWYDQNVQSGNKLISDYPDLQQQLGMGKYFSFYNPNEYSKHPDGGFRSVANPDAKIGDPNYNPIINYQTPTPPVRPQKPVVNVSPDHKPVEIGPNLTYNPNMGTYANSQTGKGVGTLVQQYKGGGLIKGYAGGGSPGYNERFQAVNQLNTDQNEQEAAKKLKDERQERNGRIGQIAGTAALGIGSTMYNNVSNDDDQTKQTKSAIDVGLQSTDSKLGVSPWYGLAKGASDIGRSKLPRDKYGNVTGDVNRGLDEFMAPMHENATAAYKREGVGGLAKEFFTPAAALRGGADILGIGNQTTGLIGKLNKFSGNTAINKKIQDQKDADQADIDAQNAATLQQRTIQNTGRVRNAVALRDMGSDSVNTDTPLAAYNPLAMPGQSTSATGLTKSWRDAGNSISNAFNGLGKKDGGPVDNVYYKNGKIVDKDIHEAQNNQYNIDVHKHYQKLARSGMTEDEYYKKYPNEVEFNNKRNGEYIKQELSHGRVPYGTAFSEGGMITGAGTGKSDSINAKIKPRSFVVPAENAPIAEAIRATVLRAPKTKANLKQSGGTPVKLSNGEHLFSPKERQEVESYGIDIDALAPNAEHDEEAMSGGGNVNNRKKAMELKTKQDNYNYLKSRISNRSATPQERVAFDRLGKELAVSSSPVVSGKKAPNLPKQKINADNLNPITSKLPVNNSENLYGNRTNSEIARSLQKPVSEGDQPPGIVDPNSIQMPITQKGGKNNGFNANSIIDYGIPLVQAGLGLSYLKKAGARPVDQLDSDYLNSINSAKGNLNLAQANAKFGFTPEEQLAINNQNQNLTNAGNYAARNFSGGSSANAFNLTRANLNDSYNRGLDSKVQNRNLIFQKQGIANSRQQYLDDLISNKVNMSNRLFNMKLDAWQQNQQTGQSLISAGLQNAIGANRWNQELDAAKNRNAMYNPQSTT